MDYTKSDSYSTHAATQQRHHDAAKAIPTVVSDTDLNAINWSLMEVVKAAGLEGKQFNKDDPTSYRLLLNALDDIYASNKYISTKQYRTGNIIFVPDNDNTPLVGNWYECYHPDGCKGKDPRDAVNRPDGWTNTDASAPYFWIKLGKWLDLPVIGTPVGLFTTTVPQGGLKLNGATVNATKFWRLAQTYPDLVTGGNISLPDLRAEFIRGLDDGRDVDAGRVVGSVQGDAIRNIKGEDYYRGYANNAAAGANAARMSGAHLFLHKRGSGNGSSSLAFSGWGGVDTVDFDASRVVPTAAENRPRNIALLYATRF